MPAWDFQRLGAYFDLVVMDAPYSGKAVVPERIETITEWVGERGFVRQRHATDSPTYAALKNGGILIYSTCSIRPKKQRRSAVGSAPNSV